ncbi:MAG: hypothetical protein JWN46_2614 [Acidimicrobiales bacterium]|nr:hypothetical protein [Acidimicrobiales bacterium]
MSDEAGHEMDGEQGDDPIVTIPKPNELLALHSVTTEMFEMLRRWFEVPPSVALDLREIDSAVRELGDPQMIAAVAMRKLQALHLLATPGVRTATDVIVSIVNDLERALLQAPVMRLKRQAAATDWDQAFVDLESGGVAELEVAPADADDLDPEVERFISLHDQLHEAMFAVIEASDGEIRYLI